MLSRLKRLFEKQSGVRISFQIGWPKKIQHDLFRVLEQMHVHGQLRVASEGHIQILAEGASRRMGKFVDCVREYAFLEGAKTIEVAWLPYQNQYEGFIFTWESFPEGKEKP